MHISRSVVLHATATEVWKEIEGPSGWAGWHPAIAAVQPEAIDGIDYFRLTFDEGSEVVEKPRGTDGMSFGYEVVAGQTSMTRYHGSITVCEVEGSALVVWTVTFDPLIAEAYAKISSGIIEAGLMALTVRFGG